MTPGREDCEQGRPVETRHKTGKLLVAVVILACAVFLLWSVVSAISYQNQLLGGCWPQTVAIDGQLVPTDVFWLREVRALELNALEQFFFSKTRHRILFYLNILCAMIGWSGSFFLKFVSPEGESTPASVQIPAWQSMLASLMLSGIAAAILFLILVSVRLIINPGGTGCIDEGYTYLAALASLGSGLFVVLFFSWFRSILPSVWKRIFSPQ